MAPRIRQLRARQEQLQDRKIEIENMLSDRKVELANLKTVRHYINDLHNLLRDRAPITIHPKRASSRFLLSGLARCGYCGKALIGQDAKSGKFSYYVCGTLNKKVAGSVNNGESQDSKLGAEDTHERRVQATRYSPHQKVSGGGRYRLAE